MTISSHHGTLSTHLTKPPLQLPPFDLPEPPRGAWENLATPPPPANLPRIRFQETAPNLPWEGPPDATWFHQRIPVDGEPKGQSMESSV